VEDVVEYVCRHVSWQEDDNKINILFCAKLFHILARVTVKIQDLYKWEICYCTLYLFL
jgi:hypothetical protein